MIRTSKHNLNNANKNKLNSIENFINEYKRVAQIYLNHIWSNGITWKTNGKMHTFNAKYKLNHPRMLSTVELNKELQLETFLSGRALKCCITQICGIIGSAVEKQRKRRYVANYKRANHQKINRKLRKAIRRNAPVKPDIANMNLELNSVCVDIEEVDNSFNYFIQLHSMVNNKKNFRVNLPMNHHRQSKKWSRKGSVKTSVLLSKGTIDLRWEIKKSLKKKGKVLGADQGLKDVLNLSDKQVTPKTDIHGHSLESITNRLSRKEKGSQSFGKTQEHRKNFIHWSINQLNLSDVKEIRLEEIKNIGFKKSRSRMMSHWCNTLIRDKLLSVCEEKEVLCTLQSSTYRSQRCSSCGLVRKSHRKGKAYCCSNCGLELDSDYNASLNHQHNLPDVPLDLRRLKLNREGFFWNSSGFSSLTGEVLTVPLSA